ncbi:MAG: hypothetical protein ACE5DX_01800 [Candidatus Dojkabacteria bacterium]
MNTTHEADLAIPYVLGSMGICPEPVYGVTRETRQLLPHQRIMQRVLHQVTKKGLYKLIEIYNQAALDLVGEITTTALSHSRLPEGFTDESTRAFYANNVDPINAALRNIPMQGGVLLTSEIDLTRNHRPGSIPIMTTTEIGQVVQPIWRTLYIGGPIHVAFQSPNEDGTVSEFTWHHPGTILINAVNLYSIALLNGEKKMFTRQFLEAALNAYRSIERSSVTSRDLEALVPEFVATMQSTKR